MNFSLFSSSDLLNAVTKGDLESLEEILIQRAYQNKGISDFDAEGNTALHIAVKKNSLAMVEKLLGFGIDPNHFNHYGDTPLHLAVERTFYLFGFSGQVVGLEFQRPIVNALIQANADVTLENRDNKTPLALLCCPRNTHRELALVDRAIVEDLVNANADVNVIDARGNLPLHYPVLGSAHYLIQGCENINAQNIDGNTPLHMAVINRDIDSLEQLLANNADGTIQNDNGLTPLALAAQMKQLQPGIWNHFMNFSELEPSETLRPRGGRTDGSQVLWRERFIDALAQAIPDALGIPTDKGLSPLNQVLVTIQPEIRGACDRVALGLIDLSSQEQVNIVGPDGLSPLSRALELAKEDIVWALIRKGAQPTQGDLERALNSFGEESPICEEIARFFQPKAKKSR